MHFPPKRIYESGVFLHRTLYVWVCITYKIKAAFEPDIFVLGILMLGLLQSICMLSRAVTRALGAIGSRSWP